MKFPLQLDDLTEKEWDAQLFATNTGLAPMLGWRLTYHTLRSKGSRSGFPDRILVRDRLIAVELKRETGKPTDTQIEWLDGLARAGVETYIWRPADLDEIALILAAHHRPDWTCTSAWIPGLGRADTADPTRPPPPPPDYQGRLPGGARHENPAPIPRLYPPTRNP